MLSTIKRELKENLGDQLRGLRHLVRALGGDAPDVGTARQTLPPLPPELVRLVGSTFQTVDGVMNTLQTIATPFRPCRSTEAGFQDFAVYFGSTNAPLGDDKALADDLYRALKIMTDGVDPNGLILKRRTADVSRKLISTVKARRWTAAHIGECSASLFVLLANSGAIARMDDAAGNKAWKLYAATSLAFGLSLAGRLPESEFTLFAQHDAILVCSLRADVFEDAVKTGTVSDALVRTLNSLLSHLP